ncbi:MAG TPA: hypothetical protein VKQ52_06150, partial [Puia sp.]|nr:hypothetical protein [Puia sp.]
AWVQGGNAFGATGILGTLDNNHLDLYANNLQQARLTNTGNFLLGTTTDQGYKLQINGRAFAGGGVLIQNEGSLNTTQNGLVINATGATNYAGADFYNDRSRLGQVFCTGSTYPGFSSIPQQSFGLYTNAPGGLTMVSEDSANAVIRFANGYYGAATEKMRLSGAGNLLLATATDNGNTLQVNGTSYFNGPQQITGTLNAGSNGPFSLFNPVVNAPAGDWYYFFGTRIAPVMNIAGNYQQSYAMDISPTFNLNGYVQHTDAISPALHIGTNLGGIMIEQGTSYPGNSGQPLFINQGGGTDKEAIYNYRNSASTVRPFIWDNDNRPASFSAAIVPALRSTISNPQAGGGVSFTLDRYYYGTEASIDMRYETTPDSTAHENTSIVFSTRSGGYNVTPLYINGINIGLGTNTPTAQLHTTGAVRFAGLGSDNTQTRVLVGDANGNLFYRDASTLAATEALRSSLAVNGPITAQKLTLTTKDWPDYVFDSSYSLMPLPELKEYVRRNNHLPGITPAESAEKTGVDVGDTEAKMLKKIEELTLYVIRQDEEIAELKQMIKAKSHKKPK